MQNQILNHFATIASGATAADRAYNISTLAEFLNTSIRAVLEAGEDENTTAETVDALATSVEFLMCALRSAAWGHSEADRELSQPIEWAASKLEEAFKIGGGRLPVPSDVVEGLACEVLALN
ncbi:hypothetical protein [Rhizobium sp. KDH_Rht_773_N]